MEPRIEIIPEKKLVGRSIQMSLNNNKTGWLWSNFMPKLKDIAGKVGQDKYSLQVYGSDYFSSFDPNREFVKWAMVEVINFENIPTDLETFTLKGGQYAVFIHKGDSNEFYKTAQYIYGVWLPNSDFELDDRPHFEVLGNMHKNNDPASEEEVWIPVKPKENIYL